MAEMAMLPSAAARPIRVVCLRSVSVLLNDETPVLADASGQYDRWIC